MNDLAVGPFAEVSVELGEGARVNLESVLEDEWPDFLLLPGDVVYAQASAIANVGYGVDLYIRRLLPFTIGGPALGAVR